MATLSWATYEVLTKSLTSCLFMFSSALLLKFVIKAYSTWINVRSLCGCKGVCGKRAEHVARLTRQDTKKNEILGNYIPIPRQLRKLKNVPTNRLEFQFYFPIQLWRGQEFKLNWPRQHFCLLMSSRTKPSRDTENRTSRRYKGSFFHYNSIRLHLAPSPTVSARLSGCVCAPCFVFPILWPGLWVCLPTSLSHWLPSPVSRAPTFTSGRDLALLSVCVVPLCCAPGVGTELW